MKKPELPPTNEKIDFADQQIVIDLEKANRFEDLLYLEKDNYPYWEDLKYKIKSWNLDTAKVWKFLKTRRLLNRQVINFSQIQGFTFYLSTLDIIQKYQHKLDLNLGGFLQGKSIIPDEDKNRYLISSLMEEAISSSLLEGAATTREVAKEMLEKQRNPRNKSEKMVYNNYTTMKWIVENQHQKLNTDMLLHIHRLVVNNTLLDETSEGSFRKSDDVKVMDANNEIFYTPPPSKHIQQLIKKFIEFANDEKEKEFVHPITKAIILHFLIGYIHPFVDGNGRTARAIFYWYLLKKGYWLIEYMSVSRIILQSPVQYAKAYLHTEYDDNDLTYFVMYNMRSLEKSLEDLKKYIHHKTEERKKIISLLKFGNFNERQVVLIKDLLQSIDTSFTVKQIETRFGISNQTARNDLSDLQSKGIVQLKMSGNKALFFATENFEKKLNI